VSRGKKTLIQIAIATVCLVITHKSLSAQVAVVAHPSVTEEDLDKNFLFDVYKGDVKTWDDGVQIKVWDLGERGKVRKTFYKFLGKRPSRMKTIWMRLLLTGEGEPPEVVKSQEEMLDSIASTPGSIGYIDKELIDDRVILLLLIEETSRPTE